MFFSKKDSDNLERIANSLEIICNQESTSNVSEFTTKHTNELEKYLNNRKHTWIYGSDGIARCSKCELVYTTFTIEDECPGVKEGETLIESVSLEEIWEQEREAKLDQISNRLNELETSSPYIEDELSYEERSILS